ncbi:MAG: ferredoxin reductase family protein [Loktanella sp.]|nr:ferredoxin reductase family protein [Loktanella sp.]
MNDTVQTPADTAKARQPDHDRPYTVLAHGVAIVLLGVLAVVVPFAILSTGERPPSGGLIWDFSMGLGFGALALLALQFAMTGRLRWITHPFGADIVYLAHRYLSWGAVLLVLGHFALIYVFHQPALGVLNPLEARWELTAGRLAMGCFLGLIVTSEFRKRLHLRHEWWRALHLTLALVGMTAAVAHVLGVGNLTDTPAKRWLWLGVTAGFIGVLAYTHLLRPSMQARNPWRVVANTAEYGGVHRLELAPEGRGLHRWKPGQFAWLKVERSPYSLIEHPFTISTAPEKGPNIAFSIKPLGDHSSVLAKTPVGARAYVDGPYGAFSIDRLAEAEGFVMIAGGVGITPILSNLHALDARGDKRPIILIYGNPSWDEASFRDELSDMKSRLNLTLVHVLDEPPNDWDGETGRIDDKTLARHLPAQTRDWPHLLCGPGPMIAGVTADLGSLGVSASHIDYEIFELV